MARPSNGFLFTAKIPPAQFSHGSEGSKGGEGGNHQLN